MSNPTAAGFICNCVQRWCEGSDDIFRHQFYPTGQIRGESQRSPVIGQREVAKITSIGQGHDGDAWV